MSSGVILQPPPRLLGTSRGAGAVSFSEQFTTVPLSLAMGETKAPRHRMICPGLSGESRGAAPWEQYGHSSAETKVWVYDQDEVGQRGRREGLHPAHRHGPCALLDRPISHVDGDSLDIEHVWLRVLGCPGLSFNSIYP